MWVSSMKIWSFALIPVLATGNFSHPLIHETRNHIRLQQINLNVFLMDEKNKQNTHSPKLNTTFKKHIHI